MHRRTAFHRPRAAAVATVLTAAFAATTFAAPAVKKDPTRADGDRLLTPAQLKECVGKRESLRGQVDAALKDKAAVDADKTEVARSDTALGEELATLDRTSAEAVDAYNLKVQARDKLVDAYQAKVTAYNDKAESVKTTQAEYERSCENRRYDERDLNDITKRKK